MKHLVLNYFRCWATHMEQRGTDVYFCPVLLPQPRGQQSKCHCHQQRAPSPLRHQPQPHHDKATQTYWRSPRHAVSPGVTSCLPCGSVALGGGGVNTPHRPAGSHVSCSKHPNIQRAVAVKRKKWSSQPRGQLGREGPYLL